MTTKFFLVFLLITFRSYIFSKLFLLGYIRIRIQKAQKHTDPQHWLFQSAQHLYEEREGSGSVPLTNGSGRAKNTRIRIPNVGLFYSFRRVMLSLYAKKSARKTCCKLRRLSYVVKIKQEKFMTNVSACTSTRRVLRKTKIRKCFFYWTKSNRLTYSFLSHTNFLKEKNGEVTQNQR
jgi:hypothetical protein